VIALIVAGVVVLAAIGLAVFLLVGNGDGTTTAGGTTTASSSAGGSASTSERSSSSSPRSSDSGSVPPGAAGIPAATVTPDGLGDDPVLNQYAQSCHDGDMQSCDDLFMHSETESLYELYGGTCAGRQPIENSDGVYCIDAFPGA
jgi:hypothetical protein